MMTWDETKAILTMVVAASGRTVGETDIRLWQGVLAGVSFPDAQQAVVDHVRDRPGVWLEPGHVVAGAKALRRGRAERETPAEQLERGNRNARRLGLPVVDAVVMHPTRPGLAAQVQAIAEAKRIPGGAA